MKTFFLAALVGVATANDLLENATDVITDVPLEINGRSIGSVTGKTGWSKNGSGSDATLDMKLWMDWAKVELGGKYYINTAAATHYLAIQNESLSAFEGQKMTFAVNGSGETLMTMNYKTWEAELPADFEGVDFGDNKLPAYLEESGVRLSENFSAPVDFWTLDSALCANIATNWWLGLTRSTPGVADITTGSTRMLTYQMDVQGGSLVKVLRATVEASWAVDNSTPEETDDNTTDDNTTDDNTTDDNTTDDNTTDDNTTDGDNDVDETGDDNEADDGATGVTTFAGAVIAAVAALAF